MTSLDAARVVHLDGSNMVIGKRGYPLARVNGVSAEERRPRYRPWFVALGLAVLSIPFLNALPAAMDGPSAAFPYAVVGLVIFGAIFQVLFSEVTYVLVLEVAGERRVALRSSDHQFIISVMAEVRELVRPQVEA